MKRRALTLFATLAFGSALGCGHAPPPAAAPPKAPTAAELPRPDAIPGTFTVRQKLVAQSAHGGGSFEAVLQKAPHKLTLLGLTPFGSRAFLLVQTDDDVQFTSYIPRELPFAPTYLLLDVHRVLDTWLGPPLPAGEREGQRGDERIHESWRDGKLVERTFTRPRSHPGGEPPGVITIAYVGDGPSGLAARVTLDNARFGYTIRIDTLPIP
jgi:Protein of unknown function (DUF3261)